MDAKAQGNIHFIVNRVAFRGPLMSNIDDWRYIHPGGLEFPKGLTTIYYRVIYLKIIYFSERSVTHPLAGGMSYCRPSS